MKEDRQNYNNEFLYYLKETLSEVEYLKYKGYDVYVEVYETHGGPDNGYNVCLSYFNKDIPDDNMFPRTLKLGKAKPYYEEYIRLKRSVKLDKILK
jgi:hypothetical protein